MKRQDQVLLIASTLAFSWLAMQAVHEFGHVVAAAASGGRVGQLVLHPAAISYTQLAENPYPQFVAWLGPIMGVLLPVAAWAPARMRRIRGWYIFQFFAGFCLIANGAYLADGSVARIGDAGDLLHQGASVLLLWLFGLTTIPLGLWLWNGLGQYFGVGKNADQIDRAAAYVMSAGVVVIIASELMLSSPGEAH